MRNKNYGKLNEGRLTFAPNPMRTSEGVQIGNPTAEQYLAEGYKPITYTEQPSKEGYYYTATYTETDTAIVQSWEEHEVTPIDTEAE